MLNLRWQVWWQYFVPQHLLSRLAGAIANCRWGWLKNRLIAGFIRRYAVDMSSAIEPIPSRYENFNQFFTRALKPDIRPIAAAENAITCPVDGFISQFGTINAGNLLQAKGAYFNLTTLLGGVTELAQQFNNGHFMTLYLAPSNYHRIHMPITGVLQEMIYVPGRLFSVNPVSVQKIPQLFARNERVIAIFKAEFGLFAVILIGAMIVGSIETLWAGTVNPSHPNKIKRWHYSTDNILITKGNELGRFKLGSTVVLLFPPNAIAWSAQLVAEKAVLMGEAIGNLQ